MKRIFLLLLALCLLPGMALAGMIGMSEVEDDYPAIQELYDIAINESPAYQWEAFQALVDYYTETPERQAALDAYIDASQYYYYAMGRLCIYEGKYAQACEMFFYAGNFGVNRDAYLAYAQGMYSMEIGRYADALESLMAAQQLPALSADATAQIRRCRTLYREQLLLLGEQADASGDHETAQEYYLTLANALQDAEGKRRYDACVAHANQAAPASTVTLVSADTPENGALQFVWKGTGSRYQVTLMLDLGDHGAQIPEAQAADGSLLVWQGGAEARACSWLVTSADAQEHRVTVTGLLPGTVYRLVVMDADAASAAAAALVPTAPAAEAEGVRGLSSTVWRYDQLAYATARAMKSGKDSVFSTLRQLNKVSRVEQGVLDLKGALISSSGVYVNLTTTGGDMKSVLNGKTYVMLLQVGQLGTIVREGVFFGEKASMYGSNKISFLVDELFAEAAERYGSLDGQAWRFRVLVDGQLLMETEGTTK